MNKYILCVILSLSTIIFTSCNTLNSDLKNKNINISTVDNSPNENKNNINNIKSDYVFKAKVIKSNDNNLPFFFVLPILNSPFFICNVIYYKYF